MGNEESKRSEERPTYTPRQQGVSHNEVQRLLEQQRKEYERKLQELNARTAAAAADAKAAKAASAANNANANPVPVRQAREANDNYVDQVIAQQLQEFVQIAYNSPTYTGTQRPPVNQPSRILASGASPSTSTASAERNRSPYSFTNEDLQTRQSPQSPQNLYPNLNALNANLTTPPAPHHPYSTNTTPLERKGFNNARGSGDFVFVNKNFNLQQGNRPSAPPLPTGAINKQFNKPKSSPRNKEEEQYNCRTCGNKYGLNIFQCAAGHSSCNDCKIRGMPCGICRRPIGDRRNITLEGLIAERKTECPNSGDGCTLLLKTVDIDSHLKECPYREFNCPLFEIFGQYEKCRWRGKISQIVSHFDDVHPAHRQANVDTEMVLLNIFDDNHIVHLIDLTPFIFIVHLKVVGKDRKVYVTVQLMGTQISASKWSYELHIYNKREPRRKFLHADICYSNATPLEDIFQESKCVVIPQSYAMSFINDGCLNYKFFIKKDFDNHAPSTSRGKWRGGGRGRGRGRGAKVGSFQNHNA